MDKLISSIDVLRIAICDDDSVFCSEMEKCIMDVKETIYDLIEVEAFTSGEELWSYINNKQMVDLIFLDIEMNQLNGVDIGKRIREELLNEKTQIVYISSKQNYAMELFQVRPMNFLIKPIDKQTIQREIKKALNLCKKENMFFSWQVARNIHKVPLSNILFFESINRKIKLVTSDGEHEFYGSLKDIYEKVKNKKFFFIHRSYLVNYKHVIFFQYDSLKMSNNQMLSISQSYRKNVRRLRIEYERMG